MDNKYIADHDTCLNVFDDEENSYQLHCCNLSKYGHINLSTMFSLNSIKPGKIQIKINQKMLDGEICIENDIITIRHNNITSSSLAEFMKSMHEEYKVKIPNTSMLGLRSIYQNGISLLKIRDKLEKEWKKIPLINCLNFLTW
jgi:hypothetical protein